MRRLHAVKPCGPDALFQEDGLYSVALTGLPSDAVERLVFGPLDTRGARANRLFLQWPETRGFGSHPAIPPGYGNPNERMCDLLEFIDAQLARTRRGIDQVKQEFALSGRIALDNTTIMARLLARRQFHCTIWAEGHWELFSAKTSPTKFLVSDDPVVIYNCDCYSGAEICAYPRVPNPFWRGSRILYPLSPDMLLVITHKEHLDDPRRRLARRNRRNARAYDQVIMTFLDIVNYRAFTEEQVQKVNVIIKTRAKQHVASVREEDLFPERHIGAPRWADLAQLFQPDFPSYRSQSEIMVRYNDDSLLGSNAFGERQRVPGWFVRSREQRGE